MTARAPSLTVNPLTVTVESRSLGAGNNVFHIAVSLPPNRRLSLAHGEITVDVEIDGSWITAAGDPNTGVLVELLRITNGTPAPFFGLEIRGVGIRLGRSSGPLLDTFVAADSVGLHGLVSADGTGVRAVGGQLELTNLRIPIWPDVTQGILASSGRMF